ncbi:MAG TPA: spore germination protein, partial [Clostridiales bacterium]|nr:spore germination protein [Clostridiales bacterium]
AVSETIGVNLAKIKQQLHVPKNKDIQIREFKLEEKVEAFIVFIEEMVDRNTINDFILRPLLMPEHGAEYLKKHKKGELLDYVWNSVLAINHVSKEKNFKNIITKILDGETALFIDGYEECLLIESQGYEKRSIEAPKTENVIRGSHEGFTENLRTNISLIRKVIRNEELIVEFLPVGRRSRINCAVIYLDKITNPKIVQEVKRRIQSIDVDLVMGAGVLEELIADQPYRMLPQILTTERPDRAAILLMAGKVILIVEGTPFASAVPISFWECLQSPEDYFLKWHPATFLRILRLCALLITLLLPSFYLALTLFHQEMIPTDLLTAIAFSRENIPFPAVLELVMMELSFEFIREGGLRVPGILGQTLGIIGALILGQAAVSAQIVSPILIIVVAVGGIASFAIPNYELAFSIRLLRFGFIFLAAIAGFYGISAGIILLGVTAVSIKSFGIPIFRPIAPKTRTTQDVIVSLPSFTQKDRPDALNPLDRRKGGNPVRGWTKYKGGNKP